MKLFTKKNKHAKQEEGQQVKSALASKESKSVKGGKPATEKTRSLYSWIIQPVLVSVACFALCYFLLELFYLESLDAKYTDQINASQIKAIEIDVSRYFEEQVKWVDGLSTYASVGGRQITQKLSDIKPELKDVFLLPVGDLNQPLTQNENFSFASLDLLRRVAKGEASDVEAFLQEGEWLFQIATTTTVESQNTLDKGLMLVVFRLSALSEMLQQYQRQFGASIMLQIKGINKPILQLGADQSTSPITLPTSIPSISITFFPSDDAFQPADRTLVWLIFLVVSVLLIVALMLISRLNMNILKKDLQRAALMASKTIDSETSFKEKFHFGDVHAMANAIVSHARELISKYKKQAMKPNKHQKSSQQHDKDDPLFDEDLFDIDDVPELESDDLFAEDVEAIVEEQAALDIEVLPSIFRAYDIRGIVDESLTPAVVEQLGKAIASEAHAQGQTSLCVGYDGRLSSASYAESLMTGILSTGVNAILVGQVPTPVLYFATHHFETGSGVMVTGSHNPSNYNGFKMMIAGNTLSGEAIQKLYSRITMQDFVVGQGERSEQSIDREYLDVILNDIAVAAPLKVVLDAGNGVAGGLAPDLIEELGCEVIPLYCEIDGNFPNHHPDPSRPENLQDLIAAVKEHNADIGLALDGDGDRIGVVTNMGKIIWPDRLLMLFAKDVVSRNPGADIIYDVKCSRRLNSLISGYGGRPVMWKSGHSLMKSKMKETGALLAGEMSGHVFFKERWFGFDDGLYSAARLLEILGVEDKTSDEVFSEFPDDISTPEINVAVADEKKFSIIEQLCEHKDQFAGGNVSMIDGLRVDFPNGWGLCRASNTMPALVLRFEADDEAALADIKHKFIAQLKDIDPSLDLNF